MAGFVRTVNKLSDVDEATLTIGVDHGEVTIEATGLLKFDLEATELIVLSIVSAAWEAGRDSALMGAEADAE